MLKFNEFNRKMDCIGKVLQMMQESEELAANDSYFDLILKSLTNLTDDEIDSLGYELYTEFFEMQPDFDIEEYTFDLDDVKKMIREIDSDLHSEIYASIISIVNKDLINDDDFDLDKDVNFKVDVDIEYENFDHLQEGMWARVLKATNRNLKRVKRFSKDAMKTTVLKATKSIRRARAVLLRTKRRVVRAMHKNQNKSYRKSRDLAIKLKKHFVKTRYK